MDQITCHNCGEDSVKQTEFSLRSPEVYTRDYKCTSCGATWRTREVVLIKTLNVPRGHYKRNKKKQTKDENGLALDLFPPWLK